MDNTRVFKMAFAGVYPHYVAKVEKKGRTKAELHAVIGWLTGYDEAALKQQIEKKVDLETFFARAPRMNPNASKITGVICGYRVEDIEDKLMQQIRYLDKLVDELAKGKAMEKILRKCEASLSRSLQNQHFQFTIRAEVGPDQFVSRRRYAPDAGHARNHNVVCGIGIDLQSKTPDRPTPVIGRSEDVFDAALPKQRLESAITSVKRIHPLDRRKCVGASAIRGDAGLAVFARTDVAAADHRAVGVFHRNSGFCREPLSPVKLNIELPVWPALGIAGFAALHPTALVQLCPHVRRVLFEDAGES